MNDMIANKRNLKFRVGMILIAISYPLWGLAVLFGALQLRRNGFPWWRVAATALALNWVAFALGIIIAGRETVRYLHKRIFRMLKHFILKIKRNTNTVKR